MAAHRSPALCVNRPSAHPIPPSAAQDGTNRKVQLLAVAESLMLVVISVTQYRKIQQWFNKARFSV